MANCTVCLNRSDKNCKLFEETFIETSSKFVDGRSIKSVAYPCGPRDRQGIAERYRHMWKTGLFIDLHIQTRDSSERVHLSYLATWSERICEDLKIGKSSTHPAVVSYPQLDREGLSPLLDFIYNGLLKLSRANFYSVLLASVCLDVIPCVKHCLRYVEEHESHPLLIADVIKLVDKYAFCKADTVLKTFVKQHINDVVQVSSFVVLKEDFLMEVLRCNDIVDRTEINVFRALMVWFHVNKPNLSTKKQLLSTLRLEEMSARDLEVVISSPPYLVDGCESVLLRAIKQRHVTGHASKNQYLP